MSPACYTLGLIGYPLNHSLSPLLHAATLRLYGLSGEYRLVPVNTSEHADEKLQALLEEVRQGRLQGLNVTIPYKQTILPFMDRLSPTAQGVGAVNTIYFRNGELVGENTDAAGFSADLSKNFSPFIHRERGGASLLQDDTLPPKTALVLGAGGSARAVVYALCQAGWRLIVAARRVEQARELAAAFSTEKHLVSGVELSHPALQDVILRHNIRLVVNATPLGMHPYQDASPWPTGLAFPPHAFIYDLVYNPTETILLQQARLAGLEAINGLGMLLEQAALSFELWTGIRPPLEVLYAALQEGKQI